MSKANPTLLEIAVVRVGLRKAVVAMTFLGKYGVYRQLEPDGDIGMESFAEWAGLSRAQAFRHQKIFNEAFPNGGGVEAVWQRARKAIDAEADEEVQTAQAFNARLVM